MKGYSLVELLVVMSILSIVGLFTFINLGTFREDKSLENNSGALQSLIRDAQAKAGSRVKCDSAAGATWTVEFSSNKTVNLKCKGTGQTSSIQKTTLTLEGNIEIGTIRASSSCVSTFPAVVVNLNFPPLSSSPSFEDTATACINTAASLQVILNNSKTSSTKVMTITRGGSIN